MSAYSGKGADYLCVEWMEVADNPDDPADPMIGREVVVLWLDTEESGPASRFALSVDEARRLLIDLGGVLDAIDAADDADDDEADADTGAED